MSTTSSLASKRIESLLDENSFVEIGALVMARATDFNLKQTETPSDGVVTGYGVINGNLVYGCICAERVCRRNACQKNHEPLQSCDEDRGTCDRSD